MKTEMKSRILDALGAAAALTISFLLCRYIFFEIHSMMQWPFVLYLLGLVVILVAAVFGGRKIMYSTAWGYLISFMLGMTFNWDTYHPEFDPGVTANNNWSIWLLSFLGFLAMAIIFDIIVKRKN